MSAGDGASGEASSSSSSTSSPSSRILVLSPSQRQVPLSSLEHLVRSIATSDDDDDDDQHHDGGAARDAAGDDDDNVKQIGWRISNRYYTADVHFRLVALDLDGKGTTHNRRPPRRLAASGSSGSSDGVANQEKQTSPSTAQDSKARLRTELAGVPAVVLVMPGGQNIATHERVLASLQQAASAATAAGSEAGSQQQDGQEDESEDLAMPMGFELGASVVVCLPRVLQQADSQEVGTAAAPDRDEQLRDLYAEHGWEYVDLARDLGVEDGNEGEGSETQGAGQANDGAADEGEEDGQGFKRVREALEAHMWPGLQRKASTRGLVAAAARSDAQQARPKDNGGLDEALRQLDLDTDLSPELSAQQQALLTGSRDPLMGTGVGATSSHLPSNGLTASSSINGARAAPLNLVDVQPTAEDEELARKFLAQISQFEREHGEEEQLGGSTTAPESEDVRQAKQEEALRRLEEFLESEDATWGKTREAGVYDEEDEEDENPLAAAATSSSAAGLRFDDDFDDFVNAPGGHDEEHPSSSALAGIDLESSLQQLRHEAERVRGMPGDQEAKEREAEDVVKKMLERWHLDD